MQYFATLLNNLGCRIAHHHKSSVFPHQRQYAVSQCNPGFVDNRTKQLHLDSIESGFADKIYTKFRREKNNVNVLNRQPLKRLEQAIDRFLTGVRPILGCDFHWVCSDLRVQHICCTYAFDSSYGVVLFPTHHMYDIYAFIILCLKIGKESENILVPLDILHPLDKFQ